LPDSNLAGSIRRSTVSIIKLKSHPNATTKAESRALTAESSKADSRPLIAESSRP
jgi:hypothetical protein